MAKRNPRGARYGDRNVLEDQSQPQGFPSDINTASYRFRGAVEPSFSYSTQAPSLRRAAGRVQAMLAPPLPVRRRFQWL